MQLWAPAMDPTHPLDCTQAELNHDGRGPVAVVTVD
jgi:hypothetical protein